MTSNRERFEEWYLAEFWEGSNCGRAMLKKEHCGGYTYAKPQELWKVWQAAQPAAGEQVTCRHRLADARNKHIASGYFCVECGAAFAAADHAAPPAAAHGDDTRRIDWMACTWRLGGKLPDVDHGSFREVIDAAMRAQGDGEVQ